MNDDTPLSELLERYAALRDTLAGLQTEKDALAETIKARLLDGETAETELYVPQLRTTRRVEYPIERFREVFGDAAALEVASIDRRKAEALARAGDLDGERLKNLAVVRETVALMLLSKDA